MVSTEKIREWNDEMWSIARTFAPQLQPDCKMEEEILNDGGLWVDKRDSDLVDNPDHFLRIQMRYENDFHFGVVETDDDNQEYNVFEEGVISDDHPSNDRLEKARDLLDRYRCLI